MNDVLLIAGINGELNRARVASALTVLPEVNRTLKSISPEATFWGFRRTEIEPAGTPEEGTDAWLAHRAWWLLMGASDIGPTITHKILHHKRPELFPLVDRRTLEELGNDDAWVTIHDDLTAASDEWTNLESWFGKLATERGGVPLMRLRMHDILLWLSLDQTNHDAALEAGRKVVSESST